MPFKRNNRLHQISNKVCRQVKIEQMIQIRHFLHKWDRFPLSGNEIQFNKIIIH